MKVGDARPEVLRPDEVGHAREDPPGVGEHYDEDVGLSQQAVEFALGEVRVPGLSLPEAGGRRVHACVVLERLGGRSGDGEPSGGDGLDVGDKGVVGVGEEEDVEGRRQVGHAGDSTRGVPATGGTQGPTMKSRDREIDACYLSCHRVAVEPRRSPAMSEGHQPRP